MKKKCVIRCLMALLLVFTQQLSAQEGTWSGRLKVGEHSLQLVFHFYGDSCTLDSPDQRVKGLAVRRNSVAAPSLSLSIPLIGADFKGIWMGEQIIGTFVQNGFEFPLTLKPGGIVRNRPQTPVPPFPYTCEEVSFSNGTALLRGTLTLPSQCSEHTPVLLLVTGSGLQNRDEEIFDHKPFAVIADAFAREGIATLRYDDRGFGQSTGDVIQMTTEDLKKDAAAGIAFLRQRFQRVGVLGHSEGGTIALKLAAGRQVDFAISLAGMVISGRETLVDQNRFLLTREGFDTAVVEEYLGILQDLFDQVKNGLKLAQPDSSLLPDVLKANLRQVAAMLNTNYMRHFLQMDVSQDLEHIQCPVLALNGTKDTQVDCRKNLEVLKRSIHSKHSYIQACEGLNHLFQPCQTGIVDEYKDIEVTFSTHVLELMTRWISTGGTDLQ